MNRLNTKDLRVKDYFIKIQAAVHCNIVEACDNLAIRVASEIHRPVRMLLPLGCTNLEATLFFAGMWTYKQDNARSKSLHPTKEDIMILARRKVIRVAGKRAGIRVSWLVFGIAAMVLTLGLPSAAQSQPFTTIGGTIGPGAQYEIAMPTGLWNGELVVYAHGIVAPNEPVDLPGIDTLRETLTSQGFALIYSSYSENGYAVKDGMQRTHQLRGIFTSKVRRPKRVYLVGSSLGGQIAVMLAEKYPSQYDGVLSISGLLGGGFEETRYVMNARILFEYFFPGVIPRPIEYTPPGVDYLTAVSTALMQGLSLPGQPTLQFANTAELPGMNGMQKAIAGIYVIMFTLTYGNNLFELINGQMPFDNTETVYSGSADDTALNEGIARYASDPAAVKYMQHYYTPTGDLRIPLIALHATHDPIVPIFHEQMYFDAVVNAGATWYLLQRTVDAFDHTGVPDDDISAAFSDLVEWVRTGMKPAS
jgi:pimeloyl-ACP methyl ester carboxylesterase